MDRVHRLGQTRDVRVYKFVMKDSIEESMISLQQAKAALGKGSLQTISADERKQARLTFLTDLFRIDQSDVAKWDTDLDECFGDESFLVGDDEDDQPWV